jgi:hypothetical protein
MKRIVLMLLIVFMNHSLYAKTITRVEYFLDTDPGYGSGIELPITPGENIAADFLFDLTAISNGVHTLFIRAKDDAENWSFTLRHSFLKMALETDIAEVEYFFDSDPGYGNGTNVPVTPGNDLIIDFTDSLAAISEGVHTLYVRAQDQSGQWSFIHRHPVFIINTGPQTQVVNMEYFFDADPGIGKGMAVSLTPGRNITVDFLADMKGVSLGNHTLYIRAQDGSGNWSLRLAEAVYKHDIAYYPFTGNAEDQSGMGNHGTVYGAELTQDVFGNDNSAYVFDGVDDTIDITPALNDVNLSEHTVMMWFKPGADLNRHSGAAEIPGEWPPSASQVLFAHGDRWGILYNQGQMIFYVKTASGMKKAVYQINLPAGQWHYLTAAYKSGDTLRLYLDGQLVSSQTAFAEALDIAAASLNIGSAGNRGYFSGTIDEAAILNQALSTSEITALFSSILQVTITPTVLTVSEPDGTADFLIRLAAEPTEDVTVRMVSSNPGEFSLSRDTVILNAVNWETGETVTVKAEYDGIFDGDQPATVITSATLGTGPNAQNFDPADVKVTVLDDTVTLGIDSVYPTLGTEGQALTVTVSGVNFSVNTRLFIYPASGGTETEITPVTFVNPFTLQAEIPGQAQGDYSLKVSEGGKVSYEFPTALGFRYTDRVAGQARKKAVIAAGGGPYPGNLLWDGAVKCSKNAYFALYSQGYTHNSIQYLTPTGYADADGDGGNDADGVLTTESLRDAITVWANSPQGALDDLIIYMIGNGGNGYFEMDGQADPRVTLSAQTLDGWLDQVQSAASARVILMYDACQSGSFLPHLAPPDGKKRIVMTGTSADERGWFLDDGEISFSWFFWRSIFSQSEVFGAFNKAKNMMNGLQIPLIDADGNGAPPDASPQIRTDTEINIGWKEAAAVLPPVIEYAECDPPVLDGSTASAFRAKVIDSNGSGIARVWVRIITPEITYLPVNDPGIVTPTEVLTDKGGGIYEKQYNGFIYTGAYTNYFYAVDRTPLESSKSADLKQTRGIPIVRGDLDLNGKVDLKDVINALKIVDGIPVEGLYPHLEVNNDGQIGLEEAVYAILKAGNLR